MRSIRILSHRLRSLFGRARVEGELNREIELHIEQLTREYQAEGMFESDAHLAARREFGPVEPIKEECRDMRSTNLIEEVLQDLRYSLRTLRKTPIFAAVVITSLALGIGANASIFSLIRALLLRPLPVESPERLVLLSTLRAKGRPETYYSYPVFRDLQEEGSDLFSSLCAWNDGKLSVSIGKSTEWVSGLSVSGNYFATLGVNATLGRVITKSDDQPNSNAAVAVVSYRFWQHHLGGDRDILGRQIRVSGLPVTIIGLMPSEFFGTEVGKSADIVVPLGLEALLSPGTNRLQRGNGDIWLQLMGRLQPNVSIEQARAAIATRSATVFSGTVPSDYPPDERGSWVKQRILISQGTVGASDLRNQYNLPLISLMVLAGTMLLLACANVANLLVARSTARQKEIAARLALGASAFRVVRQMITESLLLSVVGGILGLATTRWTAPLIVRSLSVSTSAIYLDTRPDNLVFLFGFIVSILTAVLFSLAPALQVTRVKLDSALKEVAKDPSGRGFHHKIRSALIVLQVALSFVLLMCAGLSVQTLRNLEDRKLGYVVDDVVLLRVDPSQGNYGPINWSQRYEDALLQVQHVGGVREASLARLTPLDGDRWNREVAPEGYTPSAGEDTRVPFNVVGPEFFQALSVPLLAGRTCQVFDSQKNGKVGVVNEQLVRRFFGSRKPIGQRLVTLRGPQPEVIEIVGVVQDMTTKSLRGASSPTVFLCASQNPKQLMAATFVVRTAGKQQDLEPSLRRIVQEALPNVPLQVETLKNRIEHSVRLERLIAWLASSFGVIAIILSGAGLYGLIAYAAVRRTKEIGVRMALGAQRSTVLWLLTKETLVLGALGLTIGVPLALWVSHFAEALLFGLAPNDTGTLAIAALLLLTNAVVAGYLPARRAASLDPNIALRYE